MEANGTENERQLTLEEIKFWKVDALKDFLRIRGLKTTGLKAELQALVYSAVRFGYSVKPSEVEEERSRSKQYAELLFINGKQIPDPLADLKDDWLPEKEGVKFWPPVSYFEIAEWLLSEAPCPSEASKMERKSRGTRPKTLQERLLSDYKEGKAFSYFNSKWLHEIFYHPISAESEVSVLKAQCTPSLAVKNIPHSVWVAIDKSSGKIYSAYCSCFAGLGSSCNHVAALVFKLDHAFMTGVSQNRHLPCTSKVCSWNVYSGGAAAVLHGKPVCEMQWVKPSYGNKRKRKQPVNTAVKRLFNPMGSKAIPPARQLANAMYPTCERSTVFKYLQDEESHNVSPSVNYSPEVDFNLGQEVEVETKNSVDPDCLTTLGGRYETVESFLNGLPTYTQEEVNVVEEHTRGQAENIQWAKFRAGMITASNLKSAITRQATLDDPCSSKSQDTKPIIERLMGRSTIDRNLPNLKYGRIMEPIARNAYETIQKENGHQSVQVKECGLFVHPIKVFLGASPDGLVSCKCCDEPGVLEIKCPRTIAFEEPTAENLDYLTMVDGETKLKNNHQYYYQVQCQMGITGRTWCDFFVYSQDSI
ncbi:uncharacterized protein [Diadema antillarum]|uniref:uncharacterized protein n=1 Tax=Diadema antillarum TaxID=105358 RepID=UPI003A893C87